jgi:PHD/YefM family antitoxin component YafN of YafNO toxin-antitoxin module
MIELTEQQADALENTDGHPLCLMNPRTKETYVLLPVNEYERLKEDEYDDAPWTKEELQALAWEAGKRVGWEDMDENEGAPEAP